MAGRAEKKASSPCKEECGRVCAWTCKRWSPLTHFFFPQELVEKVSWTLSSFRHELIRTNIGTYFDHKHGTFVTSSQRTKIFKWEYYDTLKIHTDGFAESYTRRTVQSCHSRLPSRAPSSFLEPKRYQSCRFSEEKLLAPGEKCKHATTPAAAEAAAS